MVRWSLARVAPALVAAASIVVSACGGGGGGGGGGNGGGGTPPTSSPSSAPASAYTCPSSDTSSSVAVGGSVVTTSDATHHFVAHPPTNANATSTLLAVTYDRTMALAQPSMIRNREQGLGASLVRQLDFPHIGLMGHVLFVPTARALSIESSLRSQPGVRGVSFVQRRFATTVSSPYFTNDPYFSGFSTTVAPTPGATDPPATYHVAPYDEINDVPGQWDMHAIKLEHAFAYSQSGNGSNVSNAAALGSSSVKIALIDTGQDTTHPELHSKVVYQKCFITNTNGIQSTSNYTTDPQGHGTDTAGIAAEDTNNDFGFAGAGGNVVIYGYRVFPEPDNSCSSPTSTDPQCSASTADIASAIDDAISQHVNVISISLGGSCPDDDVEGPAIADAIAANIVVVAAAGNAGGAVDAPACDSGVIAAGASALADGTSNGSSHSGGTISAPVEYVASYSNFGSPGADLRNASAWGIVAPGGDPNGDDDADDLHWIENIWTSQPFSSSFAGECTDDYPNSTGTTSPVDCRTLIAGTSMATPHVAGVAALILSVNSAYQSASAMKTLLCDTADDIADSHQGCGRLNAYTAMAHALGDSSPPTPVP